MIVALLPLATNGFPRPARRPLSASLQRANRRALQLFRQGQIGEALTLAAQAYQKAKTAWTGGAFFRDNQQLPDWPVVAVLLEAVNELWELRRSAVIVRDRDFGISKELMSQHIADVDCAIQVLWQRAERLETLAVQNVADYHVETEIRPRPGLLGRLRPEKIVTTNIEFRYKGVERQLDRETDKLHQLIATTHQSREWLAELTVAGGGSTDFEMAERNLRLLVEATRELETPHTPTTEDTENTEVNSEF